MEVRAGQASFGREESVRTNEGICGGTRESGRVRRLERDLNGRKRGKRKG